MTDAELREKVVKGLECCITDGHDCPDDCHYLGDCNRLQLHTDALALLKAQEPVEMVKLHNAKTVYRDEKIFECACPNCYSYLMKTWKACPVCGKKVKWCGDN